VSVIKIPMKQILKNTRLIPVTIESRVEECWF
jgi:hypothetical protein